MRYWRLIYGLFVLAMGATFSCTEGQEKPEIQEGVADVTDDDSVQDTVSLSQFGLHVSFPLPSDKKNCASADAIRVLPGPGTSLALITQADLDAQIQEEQAAFKSKQKYTYNNVKLSKTRVQFGEGTSTPEEYKVYSYNGAGMKKGNAFLKTVEKSFRPYESFCALLQAGATPERAEATKDIGVSLIVRKAVLEANQNLASQVIFCTHENPDHVEQIYPDRVVVNLADLTWKQDSEGNASMMNVRVWNKSSSYVVRHDAKGGYPEMPPAGTQVELKPVTIPQGMEGVIPTRIPQEITSGKDGALWLKRQGILLYLGALDEETFRATSQSETEQTQRTGWGEVNNPALAEQFGGAAQDAAAPIQRNRGAQRMLTVGFVDESRLFYR